MHTLVERLKSRLKVSGEEGCGGGGHKATCIGYTHVTARYWRHSFGIGNNFRWSSCRRQSRHHAVPPYSSRMSISRRHTCRCLTSNDLNLTIYRCWSQSGNLQTRPNVRPLDVSRKTLNFTIELFFLVLKWLSSQRLRSGRQSNVYQKIGRRLNLLFLLRHLA